VKIGDLVKIKTMPRSDYGTVLEIDYINRWAKVYWSMLTESWEFYLDDLEVINEMG
tara:strand:- start:662 stop:829 length:168 start_codon:yes stop_codon:yes gene_type:complete